MSMISTDKLKNSKANTFLWAFIALLIMTGVVANSYFSNVAWPLRLSAWIVLVIVMLLLAFQTATGKKFWSFAKESRIELRKVIWPSKDETTKTTMIIAGLVVFMALVLWCIDTLLLMAVNWLSG